MSNIASSESTVIYKYSESAQVKHTSSSVAITKHESSSVSSYSAFKGITFGIIFILLSIIIYFLPSIIAMRRKHRNAVAIFVLNFFLGWSFLGWLGALIWALLKDKNTNIEKT